MESKDFGGDELKGKAGGKRDAVRRKGKRRRCRLRDVHAQHGEDDAPDVDVEQACEDLRDADC